MSKPTTDLRQKFINELILRGYSPRTIDCYVGWVYDLARYHHQSPDTLVNDQIKAYLVYLHTERKLRGTSIRQAVYSLRGFYRSVLGRSETELVMILPAPRIEVRRPDVYSLQEMEQLLIKGAPHVGPAHGRTLPCPWDRHRRGMG